MPAFVGFGDNAARATSPSTRLARRALWWFRWAALATVIIGLLITGATEDYFNDFFKRADRRVDLSSGCSSASIMFLNVWGVIWRKQKVVLANAANGAAGGQPPTRARPPRAASRCWPHGRTSSSPCPMLWFMVGTAHFYLS